ncbi:hypothetical protein AURDEDRAFT_166426 [Auricularia subglabra TFB-10046 SS5]|uniref:Uncharacterized protein n=1 Tax=Auricularia subglabra (strain TFB-10046 / SS5) TaxID=717982 RepID=J0WZB1_AURST|nr:hypothetical protein AURDEDRAFT_166426 [Auricularia subglabra TFB-10046 SS5]
MPLVTRFSNYTGPTLTDSGNFNEWRDAVRDWLTTNGLLFSYVDGINVMSPTLRAEVWDKGEAEKVKANSKYVIQPIPRIPSAAASDEEWVCNRQMIAAAIRQTIDMRCRTAIKPGNDDNPYEVFQDLRARYGVDSTSTRVLMLTSLLTEQKPEDVNWSNWHDSCVVQVKHIFPTGVGLLPDEFLTVAMLKSAPPDWQQIITIIAHKWALHDHEQIAINLASEENRRKHAATENHRIQALVATCSQQSAATTPVPTRTPYKNGTGCTHPVCVKFKRTCSHDLAHCWEDGGGMANSRPAGWCSWAARVNVVTTTAPTPTPATPAPPATAPMQALTARVEELSDSSSDNSYQSGVSIGLSARVSGTATANPVPVLPELVDPVLAYTATARPLERLALDVIEPTRIALMAAQAKGGALDSGANGDSSLHRH